MCDLMEQFVGHWSYRHSRSGPDLLKDISKLATIHVQRPRAFSFNLA